MAGNQVNEEVAVSPQPRAGEAHSTGRDLLRIIFAVILGYIIVEALVFVTDAVWAATIPAFRWMRTPPTNFLICSVVTDSLYSFLGGWLCASVAGEYRRIASIGLLIFGESMGVAAAISSWKTIPHWFSIALLVIYPPFIWLGTRFRERQLRLSR